MFWLNISSMIDYINIEYLIKGFSTLQSELGEWSFKSNNNGNCYEGHMFPLLVKEQLEFWPEKDVRQRIWVNNFCVHF